MSLLSRIGCVSKCINSLSGSSRSLKYFSRQNYCHYKILTCLSSKPATSHLFQRYESTGSEPSKKQTVVGNQQSQTERLKQAFRDYGVTVVVFHVTISLASLGICYLTVSNGVDVFVLLHMLGFPQSVISSKLATGSSTFVLAYAVHKLFAPVRMGITITAAPFIVRYLRRINFIKTPKPK